MCGRFAFYSPREAVQAVFGVECGFDLEPRYNIAPTQLVAAIRADADGNPAVVPLRWGLVPFWAKDSAIGNRMINARAETLSAKPAFRNAWRKRRCVILASGFFEWRAGAAPSESRPGASKPAGKTPYFIARPDQQPIGFAGLWERWDKGETPLETCTIITTTANRHLRDIHDRMPVILPPDALRVWLDPGQAPEALEPLLQPASEDLLAFREVSRAVNNPARDDPELIAAVARP
ncbi:MAG: SOS response-associated peptidase [Gammaproteobacteria bacterium]|nr:MAG: SOS response-associated peptidase [Gammaproteobacteria bacterium]